MRLLIVTIFAGLLATSAYAFSASSQGNHAGGGNNGQGGGNAVDHSSDNVDNGHHRGGGNSGQGGGNAP